MRLILLLFLVLACSPKEIGGLTGKSTDLYKDHEIFDPVIKISRENRVAISSKAEKLTKNLNDNALLSGNVVTDFFDEFGAHMSVLFSDSATINENSNNFEAFGNVRVESDSGLTLTTARLIWDNRYRLVLSKDSVRFTTRRQDTLYGIGFESDMDLTNWKITKPHGVTSRWLRK
ncbi:MAG: hypothetical protein H8D46_04770 [FCB group bacterium]|nr:hypothetical protein [FCB group bacterium]